jgi:aldehyde dehydrogenase (NAD+)
MPAPKVYKNYINGEWVEARSAATFENINPADKSDVVGYFQASDKCDLEDAVASAKAAYNGWRLTPPPRRAEILFHAAQMLVERSWPGK